MNYRHAFHAGNFADLVKHAALLRLLDRLMAEASPLTVVDTHAGAGVYDLTDTAQTRSKEAEAGVARLMQAEGLPSSLEALAAAVRAANPQGALATYPGSPALILGALRPGDRFIACELQQDVHAELARLFAGHANADARQADGYAAVAEVARRAQSRLMVLIDPPFERSDDYTRLADTVRALRAVKADAVVLIWTPLKDLETFDRFVRQLEAIPGLEATVSEMRLRRLLDPMKMNGCVLVVVNAPPGFDGDLEEISTFIATTLGEPDGGAKTWHVGANP